MQEIRISSTARQELINITGEVRRIVSESDMTDGMVQLWCHHTTAALTINENADPDVKLDLLTGLDHIVPENLPYRHAEGNSTAHLKSSLVGCQLAIPVSEGRLVLGTWQGIMFCEFDGPRSGRRVSVVLQPS